MNDNDINRNTKAVESLLKWHMGRNTGDPRPLYFSEDDIRRANEARTPKVTIHQNGPRAQDLDGLRFEAIPPATAGEIILATSVILLFLGVAIVSAIFME